MASSKLKTRILTKQNQIFDLLNQMISENVGNDPNRDRLPVAYCLREITIQIKLLTKILQEGG